MKGSFPSTKMQWMHSAIGCILRQKHHSLFDCFVVFCIERGKPRVNFRENVGNLARSSALTWRCHGLRFVYTERKAIHRSSSRSRNSRRSGRAKRERAKTHEIYTWHLVAIFLFPCLPKHDWGESLKLFVADPGFSAKKRTNRPGWSADFAPCGNINKFCLLRGDQKILCGFYNGGLLEA